jgi:hypothetical protein
MNSLHSDSTIFSGLRSLDKSFAASLHLSKDTQELVFSDLLYSRGHFFDRSNFGPRPHSFYYKASKPCHQTATAQQLGEKDLARISHCADDVQNHLLMVMFSNVTLQSPVTNFSTKERHAFLSRKSAPRSNKPTPAPSKSNLNKQLTDGQIQSFLLRESLLYSKKATLKFSSLYPSTSVPKITLVQGTPKIDRSLFNTLLISSLRASKSKLSESGLPVPKKFSKHLVLLFSRQICLALRLQLDDDRARSSQAKLKQKNVLLKGKAPAKPQFDRLPKQERKISFVPSTSEPTPPTPVAEQETPESPLPSPLPSVLSMPNDAFKRPFVEMDDYSVATDLFKDSPTAEVLYTRLSKLTPLQKLAVDHLVFVSCNSRVFRNYAALHPEPLHSYESLLALMSLSLYKDVRPFPLSTDSSGFFCLPVSVSLRPIPTTFESHDPIRLDLRNVPCDFTPSLSYDLVLTWKAHEHYSQPRVLPEFEISRR